MSISVFRHEALKLIADMNPDWVIGAPPCTALSSWNYALTHKEMDAEAVRDKLAEGSIHLKFCCRMYRRQMRRGLFVRASRHGQLLENGRGEGRLGNGLR